MDSERPNPRRTGARVEERTVTAQVRSASRRAQAARLVAYLLVRQVVMVHGGVAALAIDGRGRQTVDLQGHVPVVRAVNGVVRDLIARGTADIGRVLPSGCHPPFS
jgi:hypothetical protein